MQYFITCRYSVSIRQIAEHIFHCKPKYGAPTRKGGTPMNNAVQY